MTSYSPRAFKKWSFCIFLTNSGYSKTFFNVVFSVILITLMLLLQVIMCKNQSIAGRFLFTGSLPCAKICPRAGDIAKIGQSTTLSVIFIF